MDRPARRLWRPSSRSLPARSSARLRTAARTAMEPSTSSWCRTAREDHYHKRSNVESTFNMIKSKFGDAVRRKTDDAQTNEVLLKILYHNICVVIQSVYELGVDPQFGLEIAA